MSDSESDDGDMIQFNVEGFDPEENDLHMLKTFLKQSLYGIPKFTSVSLSQLAQIIIGNSGKVGSVLRQVSDEPEAEVEEPSSKKRQTDDMEVESEENDDAILGLASVIPSNKWPSALKSALIDNDTNMGSTGWLVNERLESLPIQTALPLLASTMQECMMCMKEIKQVVLLARALSEKDKCKDITELDFFQDEYNLLLHSPAVKSKKFFKAVDIEPCRRNMWEASAFDDDNENDDRDQHEKSPMLYHYKVAFTITCKDLYDFCQAVAASHMTATGDGINGN